MSYDLAVENDELLVHPEYASNPAVQALLQQVVTLRICVLECTNLISPAVLALFPSCRRAIISRDDDLGESAARTFNPFPLVVKSLCALPNLQIIDVHTSMAPSVVDAPEYLQRLLNSFSQLSRIPSLQVVRILYEHRRAIKTREYIPAIHVFYPLLRQCSSAQPATRWEVHIMSDYGDEDRFDLADGRLKCLELRNDVLKILKSDSDSRSEFLALQEIARAAHSTPNPHTQSIIDLLQRMTPTV